MAAGEAGQCPGPNDHDNPAGGHVRALPASGWQELVATHDVDVLVSEIRQELQGIRKSPAEDAGEGALRMGSNALPERGLHSGELANQPLTNAPASMTVNEGIAAWSSLQADPIKTDIPEEMQLKDYLRVIIERLSGLENRLEEWKAEQQGLVEGALRRSRPQRSTGRVSNFRARSAQETEHELPVSTACSEEGRGDPPDAPGQGRKERSRRFKSREERLEKLGRSRSNLSSLGQKEGKARLGDRDSAATARLGDRDSGSNHSSANDGHKDMKRVEEIRRSVMGTSRMRPQQESVTSKRQILFTHSTMDGLHRKTRGSILSAVVHHPAFDYFFATMIMLNSLFIGVQTEVRVRTIGAEEPMIFDVVEKVFAGLFLIELTMRMAALKSDFFSRKTLLWNIFDMVLVAMSVVEVILFLAAGNTGGASTGKTDASEIGKVIRMFRMARIVRIMRVLRFLAELRIMVTLILHSARSLFWLLILLILILYIFAIFFTQGVTDYLSVPGQAESGVRGALIDNYGSMFLSAFTLFASITGGVSWRDVLFPLARTGWGFTVLFIIYIFFSVFSVLNIVTGVFVDGAIQRSSQERDLRLEKEKEQKHMYVSMLTELLEEIDIDDTGVITREDLQDAFLSEQVRYYFSVLDIDVTDSNYLFDMLDLDGSGEVDMEEFVNGCLRLKGNAKSIDIHMLMYELKMMMNHLSSALDCPNPGPLRVSNVSRA